MTQLSTGGGLRSPDLGHPDTFTDGWFDYGFSRVFFGNDRVIGWYEGPVPHLKVMEPGIEDVEGIVER